MGTESGVFVIVAINLLVLAAMFGHMRGRITAHDKTLERHGRKLEALTIAVTQISTLCSVHFANPHSSSNLTALQQTVAKLNGGEGEDAESFPFEKQI